MIKNKFCQSLGTLLYSGSTVLSRQQKIRSSSVFEIHICGRRVAPSCVRESRHLSWNIANFGRPEKYILVDFKWPGIYFCYQNSTFVSYLSHILYILYHIMFFFNQTEALRHKYRYIRFIISL